MVRYRIYRFVSPKVKRFIHEAIEEYETRTCLKFMEVINGDYIEFTDFNFGDCSSNSVGKSRERIQIINLGLGCREHATILHEIGHAIGFWHEQSRPDIETDT